MWRKFKKLFKKGKNREIAPDEIFLDSTNLPQFDRSQFEGRLEKPIPGRTIFVVSMVFLLVGFVFTYRLWNLQIVQGREFAEQSENNRLRHTLVFSDRGVIEDRNGALLAWNENNPNDSDFSLRKYATTSGMSHVLGYIKYPTKDNAGFYFREDYEGVDGVEKVYNELLKGENGLKITETDARGKMKSQSVLNPPKNGETLKLSIDVRLQDKLYSVMQSTAEQYGFAGGAGVMMDVTTGEVVMQVSYPEYSSDVMSDGSDREKISFYLNDNTRPLLNKTTGGLYVPGSIIKPFVALGALNERVITPEKVIYTNGQLVVPNPYNPSLPTIFRDWKNHGPVDMRKAIEQSSDVYFYQVGGGFEDQRGIGILNIEKYVKMFGFGEAMGTPYFGTRVGVVPNPEWKKANFDGEDWRVGNTYHTAIGQYGFQVTPIQVVRAVAGIANYGTIVTPTIVKSEENTKPELYRQVALPKAYYDVIHDGMRRGATQGTAKALGVSYVDIAAKTGTAELGVSKEYVNSWVTGFFPYEKPKYAFVVLMERGHKSNLVGSSFVTRQLFDWMNQNTPEYFK